MFATIEQLFYCINNLHWSVAGTKVQYKCCLGIF